MKRIFRAISPSLLAATMILGLCIPLLIQSSSSAYAQQRHAERYALPVADNEFPIWAWGAFFPDTLPPDSCFTLLSEAGCNIAMQTIYTDTTLMARVLDKAGEYNLKMVFASSVIGNMDRLPATVSQLKNHPSLLGYFVFDEPSSSEFERCRQYKDLISRYDPNALTYINLVATWGTFGKSRYGFPNMTDYTEQFIKEVDPSYLSVDIYPVRTNGGVHVLSDYYATYEALRTACEKYNLPFWAIVDSTALEPMQYPDETNMRFAAFVPLAYGAQCIIWWTYTIPLSNSEDWTAAPMMPGNRRTGIWYDMQTINREIQSLKDVFLGCHVTNVWHTGSNLPNGTRRLNELPSPFTGLDAGDAGILVSHIVNDGREYLMLVNHDVTGPQNVTLRWRGNTVRKINPDGSALRASSGRLTLPAGDYAIFRFK
ncbi:MAG: hypothetical protein HDS82_04280 [Bacteroidales bacterium]|nr:hypothetical protein [Bacteroidales bacterium]